MTCLANDNDTDTRIRELLAAHGTPLTRFVHGLTNSHRQTAEDVIQETLLRAWRHLDSLPPDSDGRSRRWLFTVARRLVIDEARRRQARPVEVATQTDQEFGATGDDTADTAIANQALREAVGRLSADHRRVLHEVYFRDRTAHEVAADLDVPVGTVRSRVYYALRALRAAVAEG
ncbi:sigma-70 family RNA polymerase sigma factor [Micromonospora carbonacea]|uniref:Sigma-70 family RNA polymerase sigma factor n=1 Tax=Micromonospora carbonacea TaxID=47853 RepID=A0A7H8XKV3_9ACTN|nr:sigma-70 family RNA polymerase sigma factor [Micromonospora carbonacea]MBB5826014.1 RNA polymerase sigma-70 factor (ECF subfamily) [Micromonospora carbonacea]QLD25596.1 sigma-70 family RNA polymerase sigma factor [Micromonospora carbonacea]